MRAGPSQTIKLIETDWPLSRVADRAGLSFPEYMNVVAFKRERQRNPRGSSAGNMDQVSQHRVVGSCARVEIRNPKPEIRNKFKA